MEKTEYFYNDVTTKLPSMLQSKVVVFLLNWVVPPLYLYAWIINLDNIKSTILFICALIFGAIRAYYWVVRTKITNELKKEQAESARLDNEIKELERKRIERQFNRDA